MRYVWDLQPAYMNALGPIKRLALSCVAGPVRRWDRAAADSVTAFIANSLHVADRIRRHYGRNAVVIHPPVDVPDAPDFASPDDYYLVLGQLTGYKRTDLAIEACNRLRRRLVVIGEGEERVRLEQLAGPTIELLGWQEDAATRDYLRRCRALLFCGEEDFGIVPVEAQAAGRPVIAYGVGGAAETVVDGQTGITFGAQSPDAVVDAIRRFERDEDQFSPDACYTHARQFSQSAFARRFRQFFDHCLDVFDRSGPDFVRKDVERMAPDEFLV
jgi:glycosyltransferase involved in cell wall biosynthesis